MLAGVVALAGAASSRGTPDEDRWPVVRTLHFAVHHESPRLPRDFIRRAEAMHGRLRKELWGLTDWLANERTDVYVYKSRRSFQAGRFDPPEWSAGTFMVRSGPRGMSRSLGLPEPLDYRTMAHELTHMVLHAYFAVSGEEPPKWFNEGLAKVMEHEAPLPGDRGPRVSDPVPLREFVRSGPGGHADQAGDWYRQAESLVFFLKEKGKAGRFTRFVRELRQGEAVERALMRVYGFRNLSDAEKAWRRWASL